MRWSSFVAAFVIGVLLSLYTDLSWYWLIPIALAGAGIETLLKWMWKRKKDTVTKSE